MIIGIPREIMSGESRVAATPETVARLRSDGFTVLCEQKCGAGAFFSDDDYAASGAELIADPALLYRRADLILKVKEPLYNAAVGRHEIDLMHAGQYLITFIHPASPVNHEMVRKMAAQGIIGLTLDGIPRISRAQNMDALTSMSTCAGYKGFLIAANKLARFVPQIFCSVGMIKPVQTLVIGAGVAGLQALATAKRLGSVIYAADIRPAAIEQARSLGAKIVDLGIAEALAVGPGGYALPLDPAQLARERQVLEPVIREMDIVFCAALVPSRVAPLLISREMVTAMKPGSVITDISIDQGGNCELTPSGGESDYQGVKLVGIKNIPGLLATSATWMFANNVYNLVHYLCQDGKLQLNRQDDIVRGILTTIDGKVVHAGALEAMGV